MLTPVRQGKRQRMRERQCEREIERERKIQLSKLVSFFLQSQLLKINNSYLLSKHYYNIVAYFTYIERVIYSCCTCHTCGRFIKEPSFVRHI